MVNQFAEKIRERLREIEAELAGYAALTEEREQLKGVLAFYEGGSTESVRRTAPPAAPRALQNQRVSKTGRPLFQKRPSGPTERVMDVVRNNPGLTYSEILSRAAQGLESGAQDPERSAASTLQSLVKRERIVRHDGKHYVPEGVR